MDSVMRAWRLETLGTAPSLRQIADPVPGPGEVLVKVAAAGVNFADLLILSGQYQDRQPPPFTPGFEFSGTVVAAPGPPHGASPSPGTRVAGFARNGAFAEQIVVPVAQVTPLPAHVTDIEAAALPVAYGTAELALVDKAHIRPGETLLVTGAAGGVGLAAVELGHLLGARVIASARGADRLAVATAAGADHMIDSDAPDLKDRLRALGGVDVVFDTVGGPAFEAALRACRPNARMLAIGFASGEVPQIPANQLLIRNVSVIGLWWGAYIGLDPWLLNRGLAALLTRPLRPHVSHVLGLEDLPLALALLRDRKATGKVVLTP